MLNPKLIKDVYSTEEIKTNEVWIDGKPIYRKTFFLNNNSSFSASFTLENISSLNIDLLVKEPDAVFYFRRTDNKVYYECGNNYYTASDDYFRVITRKESGNMALLVYLGSIQVSKGDNRKMHATIHYTKTTD